MLNLLVWRHQIGENYQIFVTHPRETKTRTKDQSDIFRVYINPIVVEEGEKQVVIWEGCGSVANGVIFGPVRRPAVITIEALDENGNKFRFSADGILGRVIQHEMDHLQGIEFLEKIENNRDLVSLVVYRETIMNSPEHKQATEITIKKRK